MQVLHQLPKFQDDRLMVGLDTADDAAVVKLTDEIAVIQTVDFFTPIVDDPYDFGRIAAANSLSDIYAMGGDPLLALNLVGFPTSLCADMLGDVLRGGADVVMQAKAVIAGGHSVDDKEPKYGLSVMGLVHPDRVVTNAAAEPTDVLVLTKPLGTGILNTAIKRGLLGDDEVKQLVEIMVTLNDVAKDAMLAGGVKAATDVTGFGLIGHAYEMAVASHVTLEIDHDQVPLMPRVRELAEQGVGPGGTGRNKSYAGKGLAIIGDVPEVYADILFDPQTSGGLLMAVPEESLDTVLKALEENLTTAYAVIGRVLPAGEKPIRLK
jgi:selenide,water dikinase